MAGRGVPETPNEKLRRVYGLGQQWRPEVHLRGTDEMVTFASRPDDARLVVDLFARYLPSDVDQTIVDATACLGGNTVPLAQQFKHVIGIEIQKETFEDLRYNLTQLQSTAVLMHADFVSLLNTDAERARIETATGLLIDAPWEGQDYHTRVEYEMYLGIKPNPQTPLTEVVITAFERLPHLAVVILKVPFNYGTSALLQALRARVMPTTFHVEQVPGYDLIVVRLDREARSKRVKHLAWLSVKPRATLGEHSVPDHLRREFSSEQRRISRNQKNKGRSASATPAPSEAPAVARYQTPGARAARQQATHVPDPGPFRRGPPTGPTRW